MSKLPEKIELDIHGETIEFSLTDKREIKYYGKTKTSNESLWRTDKLDDNEIFYQTEWGWGIFVTVEERELSLKEQAYVYNNLLEKQNYNPKWQSKIKDIDKLSEGELMTILQRLPGPTKLITITYNDKTIESYV